MNITISTELGTITAPLMVLVPSVVFLIVGLGVALVLAYEKAGKNEQR